MIFFPQMILFPLSLSEEDNEQQKMESELQEMHGRALDYIERARKQVVPSIEEAAAMRWLLG